MGNRCGDKVRHVPPSEPPSPVSQGQPAMAPIASQETQVEHREDEEEIVVVLSDPPNNMSSPQPGASLPNWLKRVITPDSTFAIDKFTLLEAYHTLCPSPHMSNDILIRLMLKVFDQAFDTEHEGKLLLAGLRWVCDDEHERQRVRKERRENVDRISNFLLTVGAGKVSKGVDTKGVDTGPGLSAVPNPSLSYDGATTPSAGEQASPPAKHGAAPTLNDGPPSSADDDLSAQLVELELSGARSLIVEWMKAVLALDKDGVIDCCDIAQAYEARDLSAAFPKGRPAVGSMLMARLAIDAFKISNSEVSAVPAGIAILRGLRWRAIERSAWSVTVPYQVFPETFRNEAHKLLHIPDPERTELWLRTLFVIDIEASTSALSVCELYERVFWRWADTHLFLPRAELFKAILKTFRGCRAIEVSENYTVLLGIRLAEKARSARDVLAQKQKRELHRLKNTGEIDQPRSLFAQKLRQDPLLVRSTHDGKGTSTPGAWVARVQRRGRHPQTGAVLPLGDEEPGFPGLSMKRRQARYKLEVEGYNKRVAAMGSKLHKTLPPQVRIQPPVSGDQGITYV